MAYSTALTNFAQSVYLAIKNRYFDDIAGTDGQDYITQVIDWTNQYLDELENTVDSMGRPVYWNFMRTPSFEMGTVAAGDTSMDVADGVLQVIPSFRRPLTITVDGTVVSKWTVVTADQLDPSSSQNLVAQLGDALYFNRAIKDDEDGGTVNVDVTESIDRLASNNANALTQVKPKQLLVLGVAKNSSLPDIIQGGLSPSFVQKYNDLLTSAIMLNNRTAGVETADRDDFGFVGGIGF